MLDQAILVSLENRESISHSLPDSILNSGDVDVMMSFVDDHERYFIVHDLDKAKHSWATYPLNDFEALWEYDAEKIKTQFVEVKRKK